MKSRCSFFLLEDLQLREPSAHLLLGVGWGNPTRQERAKLRHSLRSAIASPRDITQFAHQCADAPKPEHPRDTILAIQCRVVRRVAVGRIDDAEDHTRRDRDLQ